jgi:hypothetical protein
MFTKKKLKSSSNPRIGISYEFPFVNPIIVSSDNGIVDGQTRYIVCQQNGLPIKHITLPFSSSELHKPECIREIKSIKTEQRKHLEKWFNKNRIGHEEQITVCASDDKIFYFYKYKDKLETNEVYTRLFREAYILSSNNFEYRDQIRELFLSDRIIKEYLMTKDEIKRLTDLPNEITIYRGMSELEEENKEYGVSWTLDKSIAEKFAKSYLHNYDTRSQKHFVKSLEIKKSNVLAYFNDRNEEEVIYIH